MLFHEIHCSDIEILLSHDLWKIRGVFLLGVGWVLCLVRVTSELKHIDQGDHYISSVLFCSPIKSFDFYLHNHRSQILFTAGISNTATANNGASQVQQPASKEEEPFCPHNNTSLHNTHTLKTIAVLRPQQKIKHNCLIVSHYRSTWTQKKIKTVVQLITTIAQPFTTRAASMLYFCPPVVGVAANQPSGTYTYCYCEMALVICWGLPSRSSLSSSWIKNGT